MNVVVATFLMLLTSQSAAATAVYKVFTVNCMNDCPLVLPENTAFTVCRDNGHYLAYVSTVAERDAVATVMAAEGITKAYVGGYGVPPNGKSTWMWMGQGWDLSTARIFAAGCVDDGTFTAAEGVVWERLHPDSSKGPFIAYIGGLTDRDGIRGLINEDGKVSGRYAVLCERERRDAPNLGFDANSSQSSTPPPLGPSTTAPPATQPVTMTTTTTTTTAPTKLPSSSTAVPETKPAHEFPYWVIGLSIVLALLLIEAVAVLLCCCFGSTFIREERGSDPVDEIAAALAESREKESFGNAENRSFTLVDDDDS